MTVTIIRDYGEEMIDNTLSFKAGSNARWNKATVTNWNKDNEIKVYNFDSFLACYCFISLLVTRGFA